MPRAAASALAWVATGTVVAVAVLLVLLRASGWRPLVVLSDSMVPAVRRGDVVLVSSVLAKDVRPGQVITFAAPSGRRGRTITHRIVDARREGDVLRFVTRGDANDAPERWSVPASGRLGLVRLTVPGVGRALRPAEDGVLRGGALALLTLLGAGVALRVIWRPAA